MASEYVIQIVHRPSGQVVSWEPGKQVETDFRDALLAAVLRRWNGLDMPQYPQFIEAAVEAIKARGVGMLTSEAHVAQDIRDGLREVLLAKGLGEAPVEKLAKDLDGGIAEVFASLKQKVQPV